MTSEVASVTIDTPLSEVARKMRDERLSCLLVMSDGTPQGIVTERDLTRLAANLLSGEAAGSLDDLMTSNLITFHEDEDCDDAVGVLHKHRIRRLVVVNDEGKTCGLITRADLLKGHSCKIERQRDGLEQRVRERTKELEALNSKLTELTITDPLLGVGNRRAMDQALEELYERTRRYKRPYSLALVDVDHFKLYNDHYGHQKGDEVLISIATTIKNTIRVTDSVYRFGGEEFLVLFPEVGAQGGMMAAEHIRQAIENLNIEHIHARRGFVTSSFGVAEENIKNPDQLHTISVADQALYAAKENGRNRVEKMPEADSPALKNAG
ncbi:hypothetical protein AB833_21865 [Chromatiales bacterium (ex Bugula neritina AB1)]|nr:hypothetical protein AB833_21865 [Chromatiales bacterium (ex Bugula neritina AB1)]